jgi:hypothetical protein
MNYRIQKATTDDLPQLRQLVAGCVAALNEQAVMMSKIELKA